MGAIFLKETAVSKSMLTFGLINKAFKNTISSFLTVYEIPVWFLITRRETNDAFQFFGENKYD